MQVGGGPTGVEAAAEMHDLVEEDLLQLFPHFKARSAGGAAHVSCLCMSEASAGGLNGSRWVKHHRTRWP